MRPSFGRCKSDSSRCSPTVKRWAGGWWSCSKGETRGRQGRRHQSLPGASKPTPCPHRRTRCHERQGAAAMVFSALHCRMLTAGEIVLFDRSWYNRGVVEPVMGFCTPQEVECFLAEVPRFEKMLVEDGMHLE